MLFLLVGTVLGVGALALGALVSLFMAAKVRALVLGLLAVGWVTGYAALLVGVSLRSTDVVLGPGTVKRFCGFFLDCHVGVALVGHESVPAPGGDRYDVITLRFSSNARRETLTPWNVQMVLEDVAGTRYDRDAAAEGATNGTFQVERPLSPDGSYEVRVAFRMPRYVAPMRLLVRQGPELMLPEALLIGDEASLLHRKTWLAVPAA